MSESAPQRVGVAAGVGRQAWKRAKADNVSLVAAGVAFYCMLAIFPAIIGVVSVYALVSDPAQISRQLAPVIKALPPGGGDLLVNQLTGAVDAGQGGLTTGLVISLLGTIIAASAGVRALMTGLDVIHRHTETRSFLAVRATAAGLTLGAMLMAIVVLALVAAFPVALGHLGLGVVGDFVAEVVRWVALVAVAIVSLALFYRYGPAGGGGSKRWFTVGIAVALGVWLLGSVAFSLYVANFSHYNKAYGALAAVIVLLLWLYLSAYAVLLGAEVDAVRAGPAADPVQLGPAAVLAAARTELAGVEAKVQAAKARVESAKADVVTAKARVESKVRGTRRAPDVAVGEASLDPELAHLEPGHGAEPDDVQARPGPADAR